MPHSIKKRAEVAIITVLAASRSKAQLTQRELTDRLPAWLGFAQTTVAKIETGRRDVSVVEAREICRVLGITLGELDEQAQGRREPGRRKKRSATA